jgi:hypothetical protein
MLSNMHGRGFEFEWEKRFGFGWEKGFDIQWYGMEMEKPEGAAGEQACRGKDRRMGDFGLDVRRILTFNLCVKFEMPLTCLLNDVAIL